MPTQEHGDRVKEAAATIHGRIMSGAYPPATFLPPERKLAAELGVARNTLRSALARLEREARVRRVPGRGVTVCDALGEVVHGVVPVVMAMSMDPASGSLSREGMALLGSTLSAGSKADMRFQLCPMPADGVAALIEQVRSKSSPGILFIECGQETTLSVLRAEKIPYVVVNQEFDIPGPATRVDFWAIGREAADHLLGLGHRRLGVLLGPSERHMYDRMMAGFRGRAAESETYLARSHVKRVPSDSEAAREAALKILRGPNPPTALFCTRDVRAYGAYLAARELGLNVPTDLSLVGYDDITWPGRSADFLTTFPEPTEALSGAAVPMLISWIRTGEAPEDVVVKPDLLLRRSTAPPSCKRRKEKQ